MPRITIELEADEWDALLKLAQDEKRIPREQGALFIREGLERRGLLSGTRYIGVEVTCIGDGMFLAIGNTDKTLLESEIDRIVSEIKNKALVIVTPFRFDSKAIAELARFEK